MRDSDKFLEAIYDMIEIISGERPNHTNTAIEKEMTMMKRARNADGTYKGDDPTTKDVNEAWVNGYTPVKSPFPTPEPSMKWTRKQLNDYCNEFGVLHSSRASKKELLKNIKDTYPNGL